MRNCTLPDGSAIPALGLGTWRMGERQRTRAVEVAAVRSAIAMGYRLIDTAEMYGEGGAESVVGEALSAAMRANEVRRDELFIVSKVYPHNASRKGTPAACERSLLRLGLDHVDLYLLHWRGEHPLRETCAAMLALLDAGRIAHWGVSNFDIDDMQELRAVEQELGIAARTNASCAVNQVYYCLSQRGAEFDLLPWQRAQAIALMAYSPIDQGALAVEPVLRSVGDRHNATSAQVALAWLLAQEGVVAIPKAVRAAHLRENLAAASIALDADARTELDRRFPAPQRKTRLAVL